MTEWGFEEFEREMNKSKNKKDYSLEEDDALTRQARFMQAKNTYETMSQEEKENSFFNYKNSINENAERYTFFWETKSCFSQWHLSNFELNYINVINPKNAADNETHLFSSAEQYMMYSKAMLFLDRETAAEILKIKDVRKIKELGRKVKNFEAIVWDFNKINIVYEGNKAKFMQNEELKAALFNTKGTTLVEASPNDSIWGIGLTQDDPNALTRKTWKGKNLLGEILTQLRMDLMQTY